MMIVKSYDLSWSKYVKNVCVCVSSFQKYKYPYPCRKAHTLYFSSFDKDVHKYKRFHCLFSGIDNSSIQTGSVLMPTTRKQKKARKSRGLEILSDIENLDLMLGENHFNDTGRDGSLDGTSIRRQESITSNNLENEEMNLHSDHRNLGVGTSASYDKNSASIDSQAEINK